MTNSRPVEMMGGLIRETFRAMTRSVEVRLERTDLNLSQWITLRLLGSGKISRIGDVSRELGINSGASTRLVDQLEARALLSRKRSETDHRVVGIAITSEGAAFLALIQPLLTDFWIRHLAIFEHDELDILFRALSRLCDNFLADAEVPDIEQCCA